MLVIKAAGIMFLTQAGEALFLKRGDGGDHPGEWCFPGGQTEGDETPEQTAVREAIEELGFLPEGTRALLTRQIANNELAGGAGQGINPGLPPTDAIVVPDEQVDYTTFLQKVGERFEPQLNGEHTGFAWARLDAPPEPLHPGCRIACQRLTMDELGVARAIAAGTLVSPQQYRNMWLFALRITGTGAAYRLSLNEHLWRDPSIYLNDDFVARCNGLAIIADHPDGSTLNTEEYAARTIGACMLPYIAAPDGFADAGGQEVWCIARIQDARAAQAMIRRQAEGKQLSTSPAVVLATADMNTLTLNDGSTLLIEGKPALIDHLAVCELGVWDRGGEPSGVRSDSAIVSKEIKMPQETEAERVAREDAEKARNDAGSIGQVLDKVLTHLDSMGKRMDSFESSMKERDDAARRDAERAVWMRDDAVGCARDDAEEAADLKARQDAGEEDAANKAREARKDRMKARKDAETSEEEKKKAAEDEEKKKADALRKDAEANALKERADSILAGQIDLAKIIAGMPKSMTDADFGLLVDEQARYDSSYQLFSARAPLPLQGETPLAYRRRAARGLQSHSATWKDVDLSALDSTTLGIAEVQIRADAVTASQSSEGLPEGQVFAHRYVDPESGHRITEFRGRNTFIMNMKRPSLRATAFMTKGVQ